MENYALFEKQRRAKQFLSSFVFIAILALGWYFPLLGFFIPLCMLIGMAIGMARGRKWCDWYCPRGSFYDAFVRVISPKKEIPPLLRSFRFRIGVLAVLMLAMTVNLLLRWPDPLRIGLFFMAMMTATTILGVALAVIFHPRTWCMICPIGTMVKLIGRNKKPLRIDSDACVECRLCAKACPVQIKPYTHKRSGVEVVKESDCLKCASCVAICPKKALRF